MQYDVIFDSERILFIKFTKELVKEYVDMVNDENVQKFISHEKCEITIESELEWIQKKLDSNALGFSMIDKNTNEFIGNIEIMHVENDMGELGISIKSSMQNKNYGYEAINRIIQYAFNNLGLLEMHLNVYNSNERAIHLYEKIGFKIVGVGKKPDDIKMQITRIRLIPYVDDDYKFVYEVKKNAYKKYVEDCWGSWVEEDQRRYFDSFITKVKENAYIIMDGENKIGFYNGEVLENGHYEIGNICIIPEYQGKGIGTKILTDKLEENKDKDIEIQYFKQNQAGELYKRLGFIPNGETEFHYQMIKPKEKDLIRH